MDGSVALDDVRDLGSPYSIALYQLAAYLGGQLRRVVLVIQMEFDFKVKIHSLHLSPMIR
jgi:hypothetical protein